MVYFILMLVIGWLVYGLGKENDKNKRLKASNRELIEINQTLISELDGYQNEDLNAIMFQLMEQDRRKLMKNKHFRELMDVVNLYERSEIYLPNELVQKMLQFNNREQMFDYMEKQRKIYARMLTGQVYKEKRQKLPTR